MKRKAYIMGILILSAILLQAGCTVAPENDSTKDEIHIEDKIDTIIWENYTVPAGIQGVLIDQNGFASNDEKAAVFRGKELAETFEVIDSESGQAVYSGKIIGKSDEDGLQIGQGIFSAVRDEGTYYIRTDIVGESYPFEIKNDIYNDMLEREIEKSLLTPESDIFGSKDIVYVCRSVALILTMNEVSPGIFGEREDIELPRFLRRSADFIRENVLPESSTAKEKLKLSAIKAAVLAGISEIMEQYDKTYAAACLKDAEDIWEDMEKDDGYNIEQGRVSDEQYYAASALYRVTNIPKYHNIIKEAARDTDSGSLDAFYGDFMYLSKTGGVDITLCSAFMDKIMLRAENSAAYAERERYMSAGAGIDEILLNIHYLLIAKYVVTSEEYSTVITNQIHYLLGRNAEGVSFFEDYGFLHAENDTEGISDNPLWRTVFIFMLKEVGKEK